MAAKAGASPKIRIDASVTSRVKPAIRASRAVEIFQVSPPEASLTSWREATLDRTSPSVTPAAAKAKLSVRS
jgi:hypothetical protein